MANRTKTPKLKSEGELWSSEVDKFEPIKLKLPKLFPPLTDVEIKKIEEEVKKLPPIMFDAVAKYQKPKLIKTKLNHPPMSVEAGKAIIKIFGWVDTFKDGTGTAFAWWNSHPKTTASFANADDIWDLFLRKTWCYPASWLEESYKETKKKIGVNLYPKQHQYPPKFKITRPELILTAFVLYSQTGEIPTLDDVISHFSSEDVKVETSEKEKPFTKEKWIELFEKANKTTKENYLYFEIKQSQLDFLNNIIETKSPLTLEDWWEYGFGHSFCRGESWESANKIYNLFPFYEVFLSFIREQQQLSGQIDGTAKTQKAKGISSLWRFQDRFRTSSLPFFVLSNEQVRRISEALTPSDELKHQVAQVAFNGKVFCRCCPLSPRHGFTDSIFIDFTNFERGFEQLSELTKKMLNDDDQGELVLMKPCFADFNVVANGKSVVVGSKHDGATAGRDSLTIPTTKPFAFTNGEKELIGVNKKNGVFAELVGTFVKRSGVDFYDGRFDVQDLFLTQLRGGPEIDVTGDYVPRDISLFREFAIPPHKSDGSEYRDTEWEHLIADVKSKKNWQDYFVLHPGGSISSHFGVHCFINEIPYITSDQKADGRTLKANSETKELDLSAFVEGFKKGAHLVELPSSRKAVCVVLAALHNYPKLDLSDPKQAQFFGLANAFCVKLSMAALLGELRYHYRRNTYDSVVSISHHEFKREQVYSKALALDLNYVLDKAHRLTPIYGFPTWAVEGGVGGFKWLECGEAAFKLWNSVCVFVDKPSKTNSDKIASNLNKTINICHNAARMLTKFTQGNTDFDFAPLKPQQYALMAAPIVHLLLGMDVSDKSEVQFVPFDLPKLKWDADKIGRRRYVEGNVRGATRKVEDGKYVW